jgi:ABC-type Fe3+-hydroxamate transport system substrate-binding protein
MILQAVHQLTTIPTKIISLVPSQTELLYDLGLDEQVIGITKFCIHPKQWFSSKTRIGGTKNVNIEAIKALQPHLIIANKEENVKEQILELAKEFDVWVTDINTFEEALQMIEDIGHLTDTNAKGNHLAQKIKDEFKNITALQKPINTCYLIWQNPYMTVGGDTFINDMLQKCGFNNIFANKTRYPEITISQLLIANLPVQQAGCQLLLLSSEPYPFKQKHIDELQKQLPYTKILLVDGEMFSWYGSRLLHAPKYFNELINSL